MSDHYRLDKELLLAGIFVLLLIGFAGRTGLRAVYSFMITILAIWKILTPAYLKGANPIWWGIVLTAFLTLLIIFLVYGFDRKTLAASSGALLGVLVMLCYGLHFHGCFKIHGAVMAYSGKPSLCRISESESFADLYERNLHRGLRRHDGSLGRHYFCSK